MTKNNKVTTRSRKTQQSANKQPMRDFFTTLCHSDLHVECVKEFKFHPTRKWRFDYAIPQYKIALEVEGGVWSGGRHTSPKGFLNDMEKYNTATLMGWRVFRTIPDELLTNTTLSLLREAMKTEITAPGASLNAQE